MSMKTMTKVKVGLLESEPPAGYFQLLSCAADSASDCGWIQEPLTALLQSSDDPVMTITKHILKNTSYNTGENLMQIHYMQIFRNAEEVLKHATEECYANE